MISLQILIILIFGKCLAFDLTDEEHDRLPTLSSLENYDKCLRYNGTYCLLRLDLFAEEGNELMQLIRNYSQNHRVKHFNYTYLERGVCVSTTCKDFIGDRDLDDPIQRHEVVQRCSNHSVWKEYGLYANVTMELCEKKSDHLDIDAVDWAFLVVVLVILAVNIVGTASDLLVDDEKKKQFGKGMKLFLCFSIPRNFNYLVSAENGKNPNPLKGINGIRNFGSIVVVLAHSALILLGGFIDNPHDLEKGFNTVLYSMTFNGSFVVQIFFVLTSFLLVYHLELASETTLITWSTIPKVLLYRLWRLTPPLALVIGFSATWLRHLGSGPLWQRNVVSVVQQCRQYWWSHLLYVNNYVSENVFCAKHTWQLAADTQLFILALVVYVATKNRGRNVALAAMIILGMILPPYYTWLYDLDLTFFVSPQFDYELELVCVPGQVIVLIYLVHMNILHLFVGIRTQLDHVHQLNYVMIQCGFYVVSLGVAITFYILVEGPMTPLAKILLSPEKKNLKDKSEKECQNEANCRKENIVNSKIHKENGFEIESVEKIKKSL